MVHGMNMLEAALALLRRPIETTGEPRRARRKHEIPGDDAALTEGELVAALEEMAAERAAAEAMLAGVADQRESLLMQPGSDAEIFDLGRQIDRAQLNLERLDRLEPDLRRKLRAVQLRDENIRWAAARDAAILAWAPCADAIAKYHEARDEWWRVCARLKADWPTVTEIVPWMPELYSRQSKSFSEQLQVFGTRVRELERPERPAMVSLATAIEYSRTFGKIPEWAPSDWEIHCQRAISGSVAVQTLTSMLDAEGRTLPKGSTVHLDYETALAAVSAGRAFWADG
jgi:hypothetical protein